MFLAGIFIIQIYLYTRHTEVEDSPCLNLRGPIGWANFILVAKFILALSVYFTIEVDPEDRTSGQRKFQSYLDKASNVIFGLIVVVMVYFPFSLFLEESKICR